MKEVLVVYYSQTGQLFDILKNIVSNIEDGQVNITYHQIQPKNEYAFPWKKDKFFDVFPESFLQIPCELVAPKDEILEKKYDLVLLGHQVWFLTPSIPVNSFLKSETAKKILNNTPVITVIGARNMWIQAQEKLKKLLVSCDAKLVGNIALVDRHLNHISVITITHWMFGGKKNRMYGVLPKPGVSEKDIKEASKFGIPIRNSLLTNDYSRLQQSLLKLDAVRIKPFLSLADKRANLLFSKWANLIIKKGGPGDSKRKKWLVFFNYYLLLAIWVIAPIVFIVFLLTYPIMMNRIRREKEYFSSVVTTKD
jgi:hypothetical protein